MREDFGRGIDDGDRPRGTPKRELAPHWRDTLRDVDAAASSVRTIGARCWSRCQHRRRDRAGHAQSDRPVAQHRRRRTAGQLARQPSAPMPATRCCSCSGMGSVLFLPVVALAGLRMVRLQPVRPASAAALLLAALGAVLIGVALEPDQRVRGVGPSGRLGRRDRPRRRLWRRFAASAGSAIPPIAGPVRLAVLLLFALAGLIAGLSGRSASSRRRRAWVARLFRRDPARAPRHAAPH